MTVRPQEPLEISVDFLEDALVPFADAGGDPGRRAETDEDIDLVELVRDRLEIADDIADVTIAASLAQIAAHSDTRERWLVAFASPLGKYLASRGSDLNTALNIVLALAQRQPA